MLVTLVSGGIPRGCVRFDFFFPVVSEEVDAVSEVVMRSEEDVDVVLEEEEERELFFFFRGGLTSTISSSLSSLSPRTLSGADEFEAEVDLLLEEEDVDVVLEEEEE